MTIAVIGPLKRQFEVIRSQVQGPLRPSHTLRFIDKNVRLREASLRGIDVLVVQTPFIGHDVNMILKAQSQNAGCPVRWVNTRGMKAVALEITKICHHASRTTG